MLYIAIATAFIMLTAGYLKWKENFLACLSGFFWVIFIAVFIYTIVKTGELPIIWSKL